MEDRLLDMSVAARRLEVSIATVYRLRDNGILRVIKTGASKGYKIRESDLKAYLWRRDNDLI